MIFIIDYNIQLTSGTLFNKQIRVKNKENELIAKCSLEDYLRRKYGNSFVSLTITRCNEDIVSKFEEMFGYNNLNNPFGW